MLLIFYFVQSDKSDDSERTLYNYELEGKNKPNKENNFNIRNDDNALSNYKPTEIDKEKTTSKANDISLNNQETKDFSNIPEIYIPNGKVFLKNRKYFNGLGELTIKNGTTNDAVVKLVSDIINKSILTIYIRRNSNFTIRKIKNGNYKLYFVVGRYYDEGSKIFLQDCSFAVFEEDFPFTTDEYRYEDQIKTRYSIFEITLHPVIGGTVRTDEITKNQFLLL